MRKIPDKYLRLYRNDAVFNNLAQRLATLLPDYNEAALKAAVEIAVEIDKYKTDDDPQSGKAISCRRVEVPKHLKDAMDKAIFEAETRHGLRFPRNW